MVVGKVVGSPVRKGVEDQVLHCFDLIVFDEDGAAIIAVLAFPGDLAIQHISAWRQIVFDYQLEPESKSVTALVLLGQDALPVFRYLP